MVRARGLELVDLVDLNDGVVLGDVVAPDAPVAVAATMPVKVAVRTAEHPAAPALETHQPHLPPACCAPALCLP